MRNGPAASARHRPITTSHLKAADFVSVALLFSYESQWIRRILPAPRRLRTCGLAALKCLASLADLVDLVRHDGLQSDLDLMACACLS
jgi:hypothetical protein